MTAPFVLKRRIALPGAAAKQSGSIQFFPWTADTGIFGDKWRAAEQWTAMVAEFSDAFLVGRGGRAYILHTHKKSPQCFSLDVTDSGSQEDDATQVAWALRSSHPFDPLVLVSHHRRIFVWNVRQDRILGCLRGHGGRITSIAVNPNSPNIFATTSADFTTRVYNLDLATEKHTGNAAWPPWDKATQASAAHGVDGSDSEGSGYGRCIQLLVGGRSGGHDWDVLGAAFHHRLPLIVTCGADRHVKIWRIFSNNEGVVREDKPLFSARITTARVLSVAWLSDDILLTHTARTYTPMRKHDSEDTDGPVFDQLPDEPGSIDVFQWLGLKRFFPPDMKDPDANPVLRGGSSDYQESKSYTILSTERLTPSHPTGQTEPLSNISQPRLDAQARFLFAWPDSMDLRLLDVAKMAPRTLPQDLDRGAVEFAKRMRLDDSPLPSPSTGESASLGSVFRFDNNLDVDIAACSLAPSGLVILDSRGQVWMMQKQM